MATETILWDVVEEHLDEAAALLELREGILVSPIYVLDELVAGAEDRLRAHIDGLVIGGAEVATRLLRPAIADAGDDEIHRVTAAALGLLGAPQPAMSQSLVDEIAAFEGPVSQGIARALALCEVPGIDARLLSSWARASVDGQRALLPVLSDRGLDPGRALDDLLRAEDPELRARAFTAARHADRARYLAWIEQAVGDPDPYVAAAATRTGLVLGSGVAWEAIVRRARDPAKVDREAWTCVALFGDPNAVVLLSKRLDAEGREDAVWALGFSGRVEAADTCLRLLDDPSLGRLAAEAFAAITGLPRDDDAYWDTPPRPTEEVDDAADDAEAPPEEDLPVPKADAIRRWWGERRPRFDPKHRYVLGRAATGAALVHGLQTEPLRRRHALGFELAVRSKGQARIRTDALGVVQRAMLEALRGAPGIDANRPYDRI